MAPQEGPHWVSCGHSAQARLLLHRGTCVHVCDHRIRLSFYPTHEPRWWVVMNSSQLGLEGKGDFAGGRGEKGMCFWTAVHTGLGLYKNLQEKACFQKQRKAHRTQSTRISRMHYITRSTERNILNKLRKRIFKNGFHKNTARDGS